MFRFFILIRYPSFSRFPIHVSMWCRISTDNHFLPRRAANVAVEKKTSLNIKPYKIIFWVSIWWFPKNYPNCQLFSDRVEWLTVWMRKVGFWGQSTQFSQLRKDVSPSSGEYKCFVKHVLKKRLCRKMRRHRKKCGFYVFLRTIILCSRPRDVHIKTAGQTSLSVKNNHNRSAFLV